MKASRLFWPTKLRSMLFAFSAILVASVNAQTPFTAVYTLVGNGNDVSTLAFNGTPIPAATFESLDKVGIATSSSSGNYRGNNWPVGTVDVGSPDGAKYITFAITVLPGYAIDLTGEFWCWAKWNRTAQLAMAFKR
ncbi:MAG: hypothetical protein IPO10_09460 [Flavobacteriales bacterium]|nr:hypothetical protein [Flavobacteriales bacterium]